MNIGQIKTAITKFKNANVSMIKDDAMRAKAQKLQAKQKGFTLLELLVVITLLATLSTAALVAYDGAGENARDASAATAVNTLEGSLRNYRSIVGEYPEQFDNLANVDALLTGGAMELMSDETKKFFGQLIIAKADANGTTGPSKAIFDSLRKAGLEELQSVQNGTTWSDGFVPNLAMNESYPKVTALAGSEIEFTETGSMKFAEAVIASDNVALSIVPSGAATGDSCGVFTAGDLQTNFDTTTVATNARLNLISDGLDSDGCDLVIALGIGKEVPGATLGKAVEIAQVPTVGTNNINPRDNYARAIALFHVGQDGSDGSTADGIISAEEIFNKARLIAVVGPEGRTIDQLAADATASTADDS
ncbi:MAG: type II secretion system protein [Colwellia sp.]|nr:type II secretion system protein [Colwellia sp.]